MSLLGCHVHGSAGFSNCDFLRAQEKYFGIIFCIFVICLFFSTTRVYSQVPTKLDKISDCLVAGQEAVLFASKPPQCFPYMKGREKLDSMGVEHPFQTDYKTICEQGADDPGSDQRMLKTNVVKALVSRLKGTVDPVGFRIIGGIYCDGIDLKGLDIQQSVILDRSVFVNTVDLRNFRTKGDFSIDNSTAYHNLYIIRANIGGSVYAEFSSIRSVTVSDSIIGGALKFGYSITNHKFLIESTSINGDADISHAYFSYAAILKNNISGMLDFGQSQSRCSYDVRSNEFGGVIMTNFGFGAYRSNPGPIREPTYHFEKIAEEDTIENIKDDPLNILTSNLSKVDKILNEMTNCDPVNSIAPGSFVFMDNRVKNSVCLRAPRWLVSDSAVAAESNLYFNENIVGGAIWIDFADRFAQRTNRHNFAKFVKNHSIRVFNVNTGTLIINFNFLDDRADIKINGLSFKRIYNSNARCEASVSLRASKPLAALLPDEFAKTTFPPELRLPSPTQVLSWIEHNSFKATQPFAEFVSAFQQAGDFDGARDLKASAAWLSLSNSTSKLFCLLCLGSDDQNDPKEKIDNKSNLFTNMKLWLENVIVVIFRGTLWLLADHGFGPERIGWVVLMTLIASVAFFHKWLKVVGFSVANEMSKVDSTTWNPVPKIYPIGFIFLFDHLLPAYKIRNKDYNISDYYMQSRSKKGQSFRYFLCSYRVEKATLGKVRKAERFLNWIRFLGLIYLVFVLAALGKIVQ